MSLLSVYQVSKYFGSTKILDHIQFEIYENDRIGLIGRNGTGKTTLLRILTGEMDYDGEDDSFFRKASGIRIGWLRQQDELGGDIDLWTSMCSVFREMDILELRIRALEKDMANPEIYNDESRFQEVCDRYARATAEFEHSGGYTITSEIKAILFGLGFLESDFTLKLNDLSGGQRMRAALARVLLQNPELLLLDEPTNHLDIEAVEWLEAYLRTYKGAVLLVSHDRYFLDRVVQRIFEIEHQALLTYKGNYSSYVMQKKENLRRQADVFRQVEEERKKLRRFIDRFQAGTKATMAKSKAKMLARLDPIEAPKAAAASMKLQFTPRFKSANRVLMLEGLEKAYDRKLFGPLDLTVYRGERIALVGPNGAGKSTLLSILTGFKEPSAGEVRWGVGVEWSYYHQALDDLEESNTVLDEMMSAGDDMTYGDARNILGRFLMVGEEVFKKVSSLSGGERSRLMLAKLFVQGANCMLLDEPTNHLDIAAKESLEEALTQFPGTLLFVSHDRYFIDQVADKVWEMKDGQFRIIEGGWTGYQNLLESEKNNQMMQKTESKILEKSDDSKKREEAKYRKQLENAVQEAEKCLSELEKEKIGLEWAMSEPNFTKQPDFQVRLNRYHELPKSIEEATQRWLQLSSDLEVLNQQKR